MHILLVEDDAAIVRALIELLEEEGFTVSDSATQEDAIAAFERDGADLVLLDVTLEHGNGFAVCSAIKASSPSTPVIFLTASGDEFNTVAGLSMGADDYIAKPFRPREFLARVRAVLRRAAPGESILRFGSIVIDPSRASVSKAGESLDLSAVEYRLLLLFASNQGRIVTRDMMREALWEDAGAYVEENTLSVYIKRLRDKIEEDPGEPSLIRTVRGLGYKAGA